MKNKFIAAYCYLYGSTIKQAAAVYKTAASDYISAIIESYNNDGRAAFYND